VLSFQLTALGSRRKMTKSYDTIIYALAYPLMTRACKNSSRT